jgi:hypothetical protein
MCSDGRESDENKRNAAAWEMEDEDAHLTACAGDTSLAALCPPRLIRTSFRPLETPR